MRYTIETMEEPWKKKGLRKLYLAAWICGSKVHLDEDNPEAKCPKCGMGYSLDYDMGGITIKRHKKSL